MSTFESDDLLLKSQMLISKFRKQREVALNLQKSYEKTPITKLCVSHRDKHVPIKMQRDCDTYPQRERDNILQNDFINQNYFSHSNDERNIDLSSDNESSIWSASSNVDRENKMVDCGIMTDNVKNVFPDQEEIMTPVTTLPPTFRMHSERNIFNKIEFESNIPYKNFSSICTQFQTGNIDKENFKSNSKFDDSTEMSNEKEMDTLNHNESNEEDKMKAAWGYFQEEKFLEKRISQQTEFVNTLRHDMNDLMTKITQESQKLDEMINEKEEFRNRRYGIFSGLSRDIQLNVDESGRVLCDNARNRNSQSYSDQSGCMSDKNVERNNDTHQIGLMSPLDSDTVRNIINKIVSKEFCNSDDKIFDKILSHKMRSSEKDESNFVETQGVEEDCVLSDVLSIKDLKITSPSLDNETKTNVSTLTSSISIFNNSIQRNGQKPPQFKKKLKPAHSADNINQMVVNSHMKRRKNVHSPSISVDLKRYLYSTSSSEETLSDSAFQNRR